MQGTAADLIKMAMVAVEKWLETSGLKSRMVLQVRSSNDHAIHIYKKAGFVQAGVISDYYANRDGTREDALFMEAMLTHA